jgi:hypothetical protein
MMIKRRQALRGGNYGIYGSRNLNIEKQLVFACTWSHRFVVKT